MRASLVQDRSVRLAIRSGRRLFRDALAACLAAERQFSVIGHVPDEADLLALCALRAPDLVLFDIGGTAGPKPLTSLAALHHRCPRTRLLVVYDELSRAELTAVWQVGVDAILPGSHSLDALVAVLHQHAAEVRTESRSAVPPGTDLSDQEREIIALIAGGHTVTRIAELLGMQPGTVENRKRQIYRKLLVSGQNHAIARAATLGLVNRTPNRRVHRHPLDGTMLAVLRGPPTATLHQVMAVLAANGIDVAVADELRQLGGTGQDRTPPYRPVLILVDPAPSDWPSAAEALAPVLLVRSEPMCPAETMAVLGSGVAGVVAAEDVVRTLVPAMVLADSGHVTVEPVAADALVAGIGARFFDVQHRLPELTVRESEILDSIASGHTVRQTARRIGIAEKTVQNIQARLFRKLGTQNRAGAVVAAHALGLL